MNELMFFMIYIVCPFLIVGLGITKAFESLGIIDQKENKENK